MQLDVCLEFCSLMFSTIFKAGDDTLHFVAITQTELNVAPVFVV